MKTTLTPSRVTSTKTLNVVANFTNGFAQNVIELEDGTVLYINYSGTEVTVQQTVPMQDVAMEVQAIVNTAVEE